MYKLNDISLTAYGITPGRIKGEGIAVKGIFDLPKRIGDTHYSWAETDGVEPYTDADELFFDERQILFQGLILGDKATIKTFLSDLKTAIGTYTDVVPFETPYGNACVYVKKVTPTFYNGGATVLIEFTEPQVGASCGVVTPPTVYNSAEYSENATKNNCDSGYHGSEETLTAAAGKFTSTVSQAAADLLAVQWVRENKQDYANANGTCIIDPPVYYNVELTGQLQKNDCGLGFTGSTVTYKVDAYKYSSEISQADADAKAQNELDTTLTQTYANENGTCVVNAVSTITEILNVAQHITVPRIQIFEVGPTPKVGSKFYLQVYGVSVSYTVLFGDSANDVVLGLISAVNNTTEAQWDANYSAPLSGTVGFKPNAIEWESNQIRLELNYQNQFAGWADNNV